MNESSTLQPSPSARPVAEPSARPLDVPALTRALAEIRDDSQRQPQTYLADTVVPHGGE